MPINQHNLYLSEIREEVPLLSKRTDEELIEFCLSYVLSNATEVTEHLEDDELEEED